jgi:hypothetical protein
MEPRQSGRSWDTLLQKRKQARGCPVLLSGTRVPVDLLTREIVLYVAEKLRLVLLLRKPVVEAVRLVIAFFDLIDQAVDCGRQPRSAPLQAGRLRARSGIGRVGRRFGEFLPLGAFRLLLRRLRTAD